MTPIPIPIPTTELRNFAKYEFITTTRQSDGAILRATRVVKDIALPVLWDVEVKYPQTSTFVAPIRENKEPLSTSQLIKKATEQGFGDWYPCPEGEAELYPWDVKEGDKSKVRIVPKYPEPDTIDYLVN